MLLWSWQSLLLILAIVVVVRVFRFRSAADRYAFWLIGVVAVAALPLANAFVKTLPPVKISFQSVGNVNQSISVSSVPATRALPEGEVKTASIQSDSTALLPISWRPIVSAVLFGVWCAGVVISLFRPCTSYWQSRRLRLSAHRDSIGPFGARVGYSEHIHAPVTVGIFRPVILLPADIRDWATPEEQNAVVLHELAHVERRDPIVNLFQTLVGAVLFFHPAVRYALRRLLLERELACDERVLDAGAQPAAYAEILLKVAERSVAKPEAYQLAFNASGKTLDRRVSMIFNYRSSIPGGSRLIRTARACAVLGLAILLLPQRSVTFEAHATTFVQAVPIEGPTATETLTIQRLVEPRPILQVAAQAATPQQLPAPSGVTTNLSGTVSDQSGARVPGVPVILSSTAGGSPQSAITNGTGVYQFSQINPGQYTLSGSLPGFQTFSRTVVVRSGNTNIEDAVLYVAGAAMFVEVSVSAPQTTSILPPPSPLRIGGNVTAPTLLTAVKPQYPAAARAQGIQGFVQLLGVVDTTGQVVSLQPDPSHGSGNFFLVQAAMEAVRQWRYRPAMLNGQPIEFPTTITVNFTFQ
jgi:TonB family protein